MTIQPNNCYNMDCSEGMQLMSEQGLIADWCITDPPYGIGIEKMSFTRGGEKVYNSKAKRNDYSDMTSWDSVRVGGVYLNRFFVVVKSKLSLAGTTIQTFFHRRKVGVFGTNGF